MLRLVGALVVNDGRRGGRWPVWPRRLTDSATSNSGEALSGQWLYGELGETGFEAIARCFYARVAVDDLLGPMYRAAQEHRGEDPTSLAPSEQRLRDYLVGRFGGPQRYVQAYGHPRLRWRHRGFAIDQAGRDRWMALMTAAVDEALRCRPSGSLPDGRVDDVKAEFNAFFSGMSTFMINSGQAR